LNQRSRTNFAIEIPVDRTSGECCVYPLRPPRLSGPDALIAGFSFQARKFGTRYADFALVRIA
jgi:hypothetical protein